MKKLKGNEKRWDVLSNLIKDKNPTVGAEIGCLEGNMTVKVLHNLPSIEKYYAIDPWTWYEEYENSLNKKTKFYRNFIDVGKMKLMEKKYKIFRDKVKDFENKIEILRKFSQDAVKYIHNESLDFCFIDGNHAYEYVKPDIKNYLPKIKKGGLIGGHDYGHVIGGVKEAVHEMFDDNDIILGGNMTWWVWK